MCHEVVQPAPRIKRTSEKKTAKLSADGELKQL